MSEAGAASAADDGGQNTLANVTHHAERLVEELRLLAVITHQFEPASQEMLNSKIVAVVDDLKALSDLKDTVADVQVPLELLDLVDKGRNPIGFSKSALEAALERYDVEEQKSGALTALREAIGGNGEN